MEEMWDTLWKKLTWMQQQKASLQQTFVKLWDAKLFLKAILYRFFSVIVTFFITYIVTGSVTISVSVSILDFIGKTLLYFVFDILWKKFN